MYTWKLEVISLSLEHEYEYTVNLQYKIRYPLFSETNLLHLCLQHLDLSLLKQSILETPAMAMAMAMVWTHVRGKALSVSRGSALSTSTVLAQSHIRHAGWTRVPAHEGKSE